MSSPPQPTKLLIPMASGQQEGVDARVANASRLLKTENVEWPKMGQAHVRHGFLNLDYPVSNSAFTGIRTMFSTGRELCVVDGTRVLAMNPLRQIWEVRSGYVSPFSIVHTVRARDEQNTPLSDMAATGNYRIIASSVHLRTSGTSPVNFMGVSASIETIDGQNIVPSKLFDFAQNSGGSEGGHAVRAAFVDTKLLVLYLFGHTSPVDIKARAFDTSNFGAGFVDISATLAINDARLDVTYPLGTRTFDAIGVAGGNYITAYIKDADGAILVQRRSAAHAVTHSVTIGGGAGPSYKRVALCDGTGNSINVIGVTDGDVVNTFAYDRGTLVLIHGPTTIHTSAANFNIDQVGIAEGLVNGVVRVASVWGERDDTASPPRAFSMNSRSHDTLGANLDTLLTLYNQAPMTRPFVIGGKCYVMSAADHFVTAAGAWDLIHSTNTVCGIHDLAVNETGRPWRFAGVHHFGIAPLRRSSDVQFGAWGKGSCDNILVSSTKIKYLVSVRTLTVLDPAGGVGWGDRFGVDEIELRTDEPIMAASALDGTAIIGGAVLSWYDGIRVFECGHIHAPKISDQTAIAVGGGQLAGDACTYQMSFESRDGAGVVHRGTPGGTGPIVTPGGGNNAVQVHGLSTAFTNRLSQFSDTIGEQMGAVFYRATGGKPHQRVGAAQSAANNNITGPGTPPLFVGSVSVIDAGTADGEILYVYNPEFETAVVNGGAICPQVGRERVWVTGLGRRQVCQFSKRVFTREGNSYAPEFNDAWQFVAPGNDHWTASGHTDDKHFLFTRDRTYVVAGNGPTDNNAGESYGVPQLLPGDVGCIDPRSVATIPDGVMFRSEHAFHLVTRNLELVPSGEDVEDTLTAFPVVTSATVVRTKYQVRFTCNNAANTEGRIVVYDWRVKAWSVWLPQLNNGTKPAWFGSAYHKGQYYLAGLTFVCAEAPTIFYDDIDTPTWVTMVLETGWAQATGQSGWQTAWNWYYMLGRESPHDVTCKLYEDFVETPSVTYTTFTDAVISTFQELPREQLVFQVRRMDCFAAKSRIEITGTPAGTGANSGAGANCVGIVFEVGLREGLTRTQIKGKS